MWACKYCGKPVNIRVDDVAAQADHLESEHHLPAVRDGETGEKAVARFKEAHPTAGGDACKCPACTAGREIGRATGRDHTSPEARDGDKPF